jgi:chemotaxis protein CheX
MTVRQNEYPDWPGRLDSAVSEVFEMMLERDCAPTEKADIVDPAISARILFTGAIHGECMLFASRAVAQATAEVLLGAVSESNSSMIEDAIGELCNMIAGGWKSKLGSDEATCAISPPTISTQVTTGRDGISGRGFRRFYCFEGHVFGVHMAF